MEHFVKNGEAEIWTLISDDNANCDKPYLLLCGAGPGVNDGLNEVAPILNDKYNTIRFNHRGCGKSSADSNYDIDTVISDIEAIRKYYNIKQWYVLGHSWGANIALFYALKYSQHCIKVIYLCGTGVQNDADWGEECAKAAAELKEPERPPRVDVDDTMNYDVLDAEIDSFNKYIQRPMLLKDISQLKIPFLVIIAEKDIRPMWPTIQLSNLLPMGKLKVFENCNHFPWITHPDLLRDTVIEWFGE